MGGKNPSFHKPRCYIILYTLLLGSDMVSGWSSSVMRSWESDRAATSSSSCEKIAFTGLGLVADTWAYIRVKLYSHIGLVVLV